MHYSYAKGLLKTFLDVHAIDASFCYFEHKREERKKVSRADTFSDALLIYVLLEFLQWIFVALSGFNREIIFKKMPEKI